MNSRKPKFRVVYSFGGQLVYTKTKDGNEKVTDKNKAYRYDTLKEANSVKELIRESGFASAEVEEIFSL